MASIFPKRFRSNILRHLGHFYFGFRANLVKIMVYAVVVVLSLLVIALVAFSPSKLLDVSAVYQGF